ncbi:hypothetical protein BGZ75_002262, partial [Mortierella antarctica]
QQIGGRWPKRSKEEKALALQELLLWRKKAFKTYQATKRYPNGAETGILPDITAKKMSQQFSKLRTANAVETFASTNGWCPRGNPATWFLEIAQLLAQLNKDIDDRLLSSGSPIVDLAPDPPNGGLLCHSISHEGCLVIQKFPYRPSNHLLFTDCLKINCRWSVRARAEGP